MSRDKHISDEERKEYYLWLEQNGHPGKPETLEGRNDKGRFLKGEYCGGPGRPRGYKQKLAESFYKQMLAKFEESGEEIIKNALANGDMKQAMDFLKLLASMMPKQMELTDDEGQTISLNAIVVPAKNESDLAADSEAV